jgi:hypothetical protein
MMPDPASEAVYVALVRAFPLVSIRDGSYLAEALKAVDRLTGRPRALRGARRPT